MLSISKTYKEITCMHTHTLYKHAHDFLERLLLNIYQNTTGWEPLKDKNYVLFLYL